MRNLEICATHVVWFEQVMKKMWCEEQNCIWNSHEETSRKVRNYAEDWGRSVHIVTPDIPAAKLNSLSDSFLIFHVTFPQNSVHIFRFPFPTYTSRTPHPP